MHFVRKSGCNFNIGEKGKKRGRNTNVRVHEPT